MLIYRHQSLCRETTKNSILPSVPLHLQRIIQKHNERLTEERQKYETAINELELTIMVPSRFTLVEGTLVETDTSATTRHILAVDKRNILPQLKQAIRDKFAQSFEVAMSSDFVLTEIKMLDGQAHICTQFAASSLDVPVSLHEAGIKDNCTLLLWSGKDINGIPWTGEGAVVTIKVTVYKLDQTSETVLMQVRETDTVGMLRDKLAVSFGIATDQQLLCRVSLHPLLRAYWDSD